MNLTKEQALQQIENLKKFVENLDKPKLPPLISGHWSREGRSGLDIETETLVGLNGGLWSREGRSGSDTTNPI